MANSFDETYPNITYWVESFGWIEVGQDEYSTSMVRALNEGGLVWEGNDTYKTLDQAMQALERALGECIKEYE
jgi:3-methyladenine DNA glycosylase Tag